MSGFVTHRTERDEVFRDVVSQPTARLYMMELEILRCAAILAAPSISCQRFAGEPAIGFKPQP